MTKKVATTGQKKHEAKKSIKRRNVRSHRKAIIFNDAEMKAVVDFCKKYKITNQAKFFRETIIATILRKTEEDHPKLF